MDPIFLNDAVNPIKYVRNPLEPNTIREICPTEYLDKKTKIINDINVSIINLTTKVVNYCGECHNKTEAKLQELQSKWTKWLIDRYTPLDERFENLRIKCVSHYISRLTPLYQATLEMEGKYGEITEAVDVPLEQLPTYDDAERSIESTEKISDQQSEVPEKSNEERKDSTTQSELSREDLSKSSVIKSQPNDATLTRVEVPTSSPITKSETEYPPPTNTKECCSLTKMLKDIPISPTLLDVILYILSFPVGHTTDPSYPNYEGDTRKLEPATPVNIEIADIEEAKSIGAMTPAIPYTPKVISDSGVETNEEIT